MIWNFKVRRALAIDGNGALTYHARSKARTKGRHPLGLSLLVGEKDEGCERDDCCNGEENGEGVVAEDVERPEHCGLRARTRGCRIRCARVHLEENEVASRAGFRSAASDSNSDLLGRPFKRSELEPSTRACKLHTRGVETAQPISVGTEPSRPLQVQLGSTRGVKGNEARRRSEFEDSTR